MHIIQPGGTEVFSDYLRYIGNKKIAYLKSNVKLNDGKNNSLWSEELTYDVGAKIAVYGNGGTLQADATTVSSNTGTYNVNTRDARFRNDVIVSDPNYNTTSEDLGYNTETKVVTFFGPKTSTVINNKSTLITTGGTYDSKHEHALFTSRTSLQDKEQYVIGDKIDYDRNTGFGKATGHVIAIDTTQHITMWSDYASYNEKRRTMLSTMKPLLRQMNGKDSLFLTADTFFSAPILRQKFLDKRQKTVADTTVVKKEKKRTKSKDNITHNPSPITDEPVADSTAPRYYIGYRHVVIFSDSLQGRCDSISYSEKDSVMKMMKSPVAWSRNSQITGDTILMFMDSNTIKRLYIPNDALIVSRSGPEQAGLYNQVQGKTLTAHFRNNNIYEMIVTTNAETITYQQDDDSAYLGVNQSTSERIRVYFKDEKVHKIYLDQEPKLNMTPLEKADLPNMKLSRFKWLDDVRPKSKEELLK